MMRLDLPAHKTIIITYQEKAQTCQRRDSCKQSSTFKGSHDVDGVAIVLGAC